MSEVASLKEPTIMDDLECIKEWLQKQQHLPQKIGKFEEVHLHTIHLVLDLQTLTYIDWFYRRQVPRSLLALFKWQH